MLISLHKKIALGALALYLSFHAPTAAADPTPTPQPLVTTKKDFARSEEDVIAFFTRKLGEVQAKKEEFNRREKNAKNAGNGGQQQPQQQAQGGQPSPDKGGGNPSDNKGGQPVVPGSITGGALGIAGTNPDGFIGNNFPVGGRALASAIDPQKPFKVGPIARPHPEERTAASRPGEAMQEGLKMDSKAGTGGGQSTSPNEGSPAAAAEKGGPGYGAAAPGGGGEVPSPKDENGGSERLKPAVEVAYGQGGDAATAVEGGTKEKNGDAFGAAMLTQLVSPLRLAAGAAETGRGIMSYVHNWKKTTCKDPKAFKTEEWCGPNQVAATSGAPTKIQRSPASTRDRI